MKDRLKHQRASGPEITVNLGPLKVSFEDDFDVIAAEWHWAKHGEKEEDALEEVLEEDIDEDVLATGTDVGEFPEREHRKRAGVRIKSNVVIGLVLVGIALL